MKLYIPEIGDSFTLSKDWSFTLHAEERNIGLAALFGYGFEQQKFYKLSEIPVLKSPPNIDYPNEEDYKVWGVFGSRVDYNKYNKACREAQETNPDYMNWLQEMKERNLKINTTGIDKLPVILPAGTILKVDRIYIRKGLKDFSSITFFAEGLGEVEVARGYGWSKRKIKQKSLRFWVKLNDCNKIEIEDLAS